MTTSKWISLFSAAAYLLLAMPVNAQESSAQEKQEKTETKIIIIEETTDQYGNTTRTKTVRQGFFTDEEIDAIVQEETAQDTRFNRSPFGSHMHGKGGYLGVMIENTEEGVRITEVTEGSAAEKAGLRAGDILTAINDTEISDVEELVAEVSSHDAGTAVQVSYTRAGEGQNAEAILGNRPRAMVQRHERDNEKEHESKEKTHKDHKVRAYKPRFGVGIEMAEDGGALVTRVYEGSLAEKAGLQEGDIITAFNGVKIDGPDALIDAVKTIEAGQDAEIAFTRDGESHTATTTFTE